jgi:protein TonB
VGTAAVHLVAAVALFSAPVLARRTQPPVYTVQLVAAPAPEPQQQRRAPEVVQRPAERTVPTQPPPRRTSVAKTPPPPTRQPETPREPAPRTNPAEPLPDVKPSTGTDPATVKTAGVDFPYPEYLRNIVAQVYRQWTRPSGNVSLRAEVLFFVHRDGSISNFQFVRRSGNFAFDLEAQGAIEAAAAYFGPLPAGYPADVLPVSFFFDPATIR